MATKRDRPSQETDAKRRAQSTMQDDFPKLQKLLHANADDLRFEVNDDGLIITNEHHEVVFVWPLGAVNFAQLGEYGNYGSKFCFGLRSARYSLVHSEWRDSGMVRNKAESIANAMVRHMLEQQESGPVDDAQVKDYMETAHSVVFRKKNPQSVGPSHPVFVRAKDKEPYPQDVIDQVKKDMGKRFTDKVEMNMQGYLYHELPMYNEQGRRSSAVVTSKDLCHPLVCFRVYKFNDHSTGEERHGVRLHLMGVQLMPRDERFGSSSNTVAKKSYVLLDDEVEKRVRACMKERA